MLLYLGKPLCAVVITAICCLEGQVVTGTELLLGLLVKYKK